MTSTLKKCLKLHKLFTAEIARSSKLEAEGAQVLSSLANVSQRLPTLLQPVSHSEDDQNAVDTTVIGVLSYCHNTPTLLLQKHFVALEKSRSFLSDILRDYQDVLKHLRSYATECVSLVDDAMVEAEDAEDDLTVVGFSMQLLEWMETVVAMLEHEVLRKNKLVADLEYSDVERLNAVHKLWNSRGAVGNIDHEFVQLGLQLPRVKPSATKSGEDGQQSKSKKKKKAKK